MMLKTLLKNAILLQTGAITKSFMSSILLNPYQIMSLLSAFKSFFLFYFLGRLAEELRTEQEHGLASDKALKTLSSQSLELQSRLEDVETTALRHGRKIVAKLEERVRALESELCK